MKLPFSAVGLSKIPSDMGTNSSFVCVVIWHRFLMISGIVTCPLEVILLNSVGVQVASPAIVVPLIAVGFLLRNCIIGG